MGNRNTRHLSEEQKDRKSKKNKGNSKIFFFILAILMCVLLIGQLTILTSNKSNLTDIIQIGKLNNSISTEGCLIRNELVISSDDNGYLAPSVPTGEKVSAFEVVAQSYDESSAPLLEKLELAEQKLNEEIRNTVLPVSYRTFDIKKINQIIDERLKKLMSSNVEGSFDTALGIEREIRTLTNEKVDLVLSSIPQNSNLKRLENQVNKLRKQFESSTGAIKAVSAGIVSFNVDGYEEQLRLKKLNSIKPELIEQVLNEGENQLKGKSDSMKIIRGYEAIMAAVIDNSFAKKITEDHYSKLRLNDIALEINGLLIKKEAYKNGKTLVYFKIDRGLEATSGMRTVNLEILRGTREPTGLRVPLSSLTNVNLKKGRGKIVIVRQHRTIFRNVNILDYDESFAIIEDFNPTEKAAVKLYDEFLKKPHGVKEGQLIR